MIFLDFHFQPLYYSGQGLLYIAIWKTAKESGMKDHFINDLNLYTWESDQFVLEFVYKTDNEKNLSGWSFLILNIVKPL